MYVTCQIYTLKNAFKTEKNILNIEVVKHVKNDIYILKIEHKNKAIHV